MQTMASWPKTVLGPNFFFFGIIPKTVSSPVKTKVKIRFFAAGWPWHALAGATSSSQHLGEGLSTSIQL